MSILQILIEDRTITHQKHINTNRDIFLLKLNDNVMARIKVQNDKIKEKVAKRSYQVGSPFKILKSAGQDSYIVQRYGKICIPEVTYMVGYCLVNLSIEQMRVILIYLII